jgi:hypothetical protein
MSHPAAKNVVKSENLTNLIPIYLVPWPSYVIVKLCSKLCTIIFGIKLDFLLRGCLALRFNYGFEKNLIFFYIFYCFDIMMLKINFKNKKKVWHVNFKGEPHKIKYVYFVFQMKYILPHLST